MTHHIAASSRPPHDARHGEASLRAYRLGCRCVQCAGLKAHSSATSVRKRKRKRKRRPGPNVRESNGIPTMRLDPARGYCLTCNCPLMRLAGDPRRRYCAQCVERGAARGDGLLSLDERATGRDTSG